jgi:hypothetical protein
MRHRPALLIFLLAGTAAAVLAWTWRTWPDAVSDSGRELYVAWQLAEGKVLYRDVAYFNGPLSPYVNAAWFAIAGSSLAVLELANGVVALLVGAFVWRVARRLAGPAEATACVLLFTAVFATGPLTAIGSFSWLIPYSHELTHGVLLLILLFLALERWLARETTGAAALCGALAGACLLTKPEIALACGAMVAAALGLGARDRPMRSLAALLASASAVPFVAWTALCTAMPSATALEGILGSWTHLGDPRLTAMPYFRLFLGTDRPLANLGSMVAWSAAWAAIAAFAVFAGRLARGVWAGIAGAAVVALVLSACHALIPWYDVFRPLPLVAMVVLVRAILQARRGPDRTDRRHGVLVAVAGAGALALTAKMLLFARIWHYGFALGMPAAMVTVAAAGAGVRRATMARNGSTVVAGGILAGVLAGVVVGHLFVMAPLVRARTVRVGSGGDMFYADARGAVVNGAVEAVTRRSSDGATMAVLPDGVMISYLARRPNATPYVIGNPVDVAIFGEERMIAAYRAHPPDLLALTRCDTTIYGYPEGFGRDYAKRLGAWIAETYEATDAVGTGNDDFRVALLRRRGYALSRKSETNEGSGANVSSR